MITDWLDAIAARLGVWALRRLYGGDCETDVKIDFPDDPDAQCLSCDAKRLIVAMQDFIRPDQPG